MGIRQFYTHRRIWKMSLLAVSLLLAGIFLYISNNFVRDLAQQERSRMQLWADATRELTSMSTDTTGMIPSTDIDFLLSIVESNTTIPVILVDDHGNIIQHRNWHLPQPIDSLNPLHIKPENRAFLEKQLHRLRGTDNRIRIAIDEHTTQWLFYDESTALRQLHIFPYIQLGVLLIVIAVAYFALVNIQKAEQNRVWVGLSKETAHQLGTPISSLMAWNELLRSMDVDPSVVDDMDKDINRLRVIADRFSKIGSIPDKELTFLNQAVHHALTYMSHRIPKRVDMQIITPDQANCGLMLCQPLFEWVMENLTKNAVDAMSGEGNITITTALQEGTATILVTDTGKGIARKDRKAVFTPGFTTKKRGWGLGLTLAKRIIEEYHNGRIYIKSSEPGRGTTFCIELPTVKDQH